jgi:DNA invertase Pin-like site-specific DNA recombinase
MADNQKNLLELLSKLSNEQINALIRNIESLNVDNNTETENDIEPDTEPDTEHENDVPEFADFEVENITNHRFLDGQLQFLVKFKYYDDPEYINDSDMNCEELIKAYLPNDFITIYIICRVSTKNQSSEYSISTAQQETLITEKINELYPTQNKRIKIIHHIGSAFTKLPSFFINLESSIRTNDVIAVYRIDRLSRNIRYALDYLNKFDDKGVKFYSCHENIYYNADRAQFLTYLLNGQRDAEAMSSRQTKILEFKRKRGDEGFGRPKYGKRYIREENTNKILVVDNDDELKTIEFIISKKRRLSPRLIANKLNKDGNLKRGKTWNADMIRRIIAKS